MNMGIAGSASENTMANEMRIEPALLKKPIGIEYSSIPIAIMSGAFVLIMVLMIWSANTLRRAVESIEIRLENIGERNVERGPIRDDRDLRSAIRPDIFIARLDSHRERLDQLRPRISLT